MATHLLRRMGMERRMPMEMIEHNLRDSSKGIFSTFTCKLFTRFPSVFNLVIILRRGKEKSLSCFLGSYYK